LKTLAAPICSLVGSVLLLGCAAGGGATRSGSPGDDAVRAEVCKAGDEAIADRGACLLDDAACYQLVTGGWCTGPRGNACPTGSTAVPAGLACPAGEVCFQMGESLTCVAG